MLILSGVVNRTPIKSDKPWIHVRAISIARKWMGLVISPAPWPDVVFAGQQQCSLVDAARV
jgi:hypothetical protein